MQGRKDCSKVNGYQIHELSWPSDAKARSRMKRALIRDWFGHYGRGCPLCDREMLLRNPFRSGKPRMHERRATIDHIDAIGLGGRDDYANLQVVCYRCNQEKSYDEGRIAAYLRKRVAKLGALIER